MAKRKTAGDVDAGWEAAYSVGDEAPGGDNPTPGQTVVEDYTERTTGRRKRR